MYNDQGGCCAICKSPVLYLKVHTDHDHKTGKVRGLLCVSCNVGMHYVDKVGFLKLALEYIDGG